MYKCNICGREYEDILAYKNCVLTCADESIKNDEELNKLINGVKDAIGTFEKSKEYLRLRLRELNVRFPEIYDDIFDDLFIESDCYDCFYCDEDCDNCPCNEEHGCYDTDEEEKEENNESTKNFFVEIDSSKGTPKIKATVNGKPVGEDVAMKLFEKNPEVMYLAKTLGILPEVK